MAAGDVEQLLLALSGDGGGETGHFVVLRWSALLS
jgi:hypothetical protein